jgi:predicted NBD/HSP70 family sugar kinase
MARKYPKQSDPRVLVVDIGGTHVKLLVTGLEQPIEIPSGPALTPKAMVQQVNEALTGRPFDVVSIGYPGPVVHGHPVREPYNLGRGWVGFNFRKAFGRPVKIVNDAAMQALGGYKRGKLLFLGLGTGLGSAMIVDGILEPMELAHLPYKNGRTYEDYVGLRGLKRLGRRKWESHVGKVVAQLRAALEPEQVVLGGGNAKKLRKLPPRTVIGNNQNAFKGGFRLWSEGKRESQRFRN